MQTLFVAPEGQAVDSISTCSYQILSNYFVLWGNQYFQPLGTFNIWVELRKVYIGQHDLILKHHDAFDKRDEPASILDMSVLELSARNLHVMGK